MIPATLLQPLISLFIEAIYTFDIYLNLVKIGVVGYLIFAVRRLFSMNWIEILIRMVFLIIAYRVSHTVFRFLQLIITSSMVES